MTSNRLNNFFFRNDKIQAIDSIEDFKIVISVTIEIDGIITIATTTIGIIIVGATATGDHPVLEAIVDREVHTSDVTVIHQLNHHRHHHKKSQNQLMMVLQ